MTIELNHTIVWSRDKVLSARFLADLLGRPTKTYYNFILVELDNGVSLDFLSKSGPITSQHYAFLVSDDNFDTVFERIGAAGITYWADPGQSREGRINRHDNGRGLYFENPDGHLLEIFTRPYGSS